MERRRYFMRAYEVVVILRTDLSDENQSTLIDTIKGWITSNGGNVVALDHWGRRRLAYPIAKQRDGYYLLLKAEMPASTLNELERNLRISEDILRFLITRENE
jgi:small subunit ribosomal protein S6